MYGCVLCIYICIYVIALLIIVSFKPMHLETTATTTNNNTKVMFKIQRIFHFIKNASSDNRRIHPTEKVNTKVLNMHINDKSFLQTYKKTKKKKKAGGHF